MSILREGNYLEQGKGYMQSDEITSRQSKTGSFNFKNPGSRPSPAGLLNSSAQDGTEPL